MGCCTNGDTLLKNGAKVGVRRRFFVGVPGMLTANCSFLAQLATMDTRGFAHEVIFSVLS